MEKTISVLAVALAVIIFAPAVDAQQKEQPARIGILRVSPPADRYLEQFRAGMKEHGHIEGQTYELVPAWGKSRRDRAKIVSFAEKLVAGGVDVIVTVGTAAARAAMLAGPNKPIVMASAGDPVRAKLVHSLAKPGGNITGLMSGSVLLVPKRMEILKELVPGLRRIGTFDAGSYGRRVRGIRRLFLEAQRRASKAMDIELIRIKRAETETWFSAFSRMKAKGAQAVAIRSTPIITRKDQKEIVAAVLKLGLPAVFRTRGFVRMGGLVSYATDRGAMYRRAAAYVDKILKGAKPAELPVARPNKFHLAINLKTAKALGIAVPKSLILRADEVIE
jgi:putative ABC transport system substrate-binding protein